MQHNTIQVNYSHDRNVYVCVYIRYTIASMLSTTRGVVKFDPNPSCITVTVSSTKCGEIKAKARMYSTYCNYCSLVNVVSTILPLPLSTVGYTMHTFPAHTHKHTHTHTHTHTLFGFNLILTVIVLLNRYPERNHPGCLTTSSASTAHTAITVL